MSVWHDPNPASAVYRGVHRDWHDPSFQQIVGEWAASSAQTDYKIVFLNGCFDNLHVGHISLLQWAAYARVQELPFWRSRIVVVAVNGDDAVRELKGRVIVPFEQRLYAVSAIKGVDYVVGFQEHTPRELIRQLAPHTIVKGPDYADCLETTPGREFAANIIAAPLAFDVSTTKLVEQIQTQKCF